jgi:hypothetical protein
VDNVRIDDNGEEREVCSRCGADLLDNPSPKVGDDLCFDCRYEDDGEG